jgi:iron complex outermembrane receptor protein
MMEKALSRSIRLMCVGGIAFGMHAAYAQDTQSSAPLQRVEVTGSRIRQVDVETAQPIQVVTQEQIQKTGLVTVGDIINNIASATSPDFSKGGSLISNPENGGQYPNLRNLGANRLLVLVDGKRWTQSVGGFTDVSTIPAIFIDRIEVLKDGASAVYGSDAIAGVVNIILKKSVQGGQVSVYEGANQHKGDGKSKDFSISYGAGDDKASMMFGISHTEQGPVWAKDRAITNGTYGPDHMSSSVGTGPWGRIRQVSATGSATGFSQYLNHTGSYDGVGTGSPSNLQGSYHPYSSGNVADAYNSSQDMILAMPSKLDNIFTKGNIELPYGMHFSTTAMFAQRDSFAQNAGYPLNSLSQAAYPVYIDKNSYFNPYGNQAPGVAAGAGQDLFFYRRTIEVPRTTDNENRTTHIDATLSGDFGALGKTWNWDVGYNHSSVSGTIVNHGNVNLLTLKKALGPSFRNASGQIQCGTAASPIPLATCVPFDILGGPSASTAAALKYVTETGQHGYGSTTDSATANITADSIFDLPAGGVGFAAGLEHRSVRGYDQPGQFEQSGYSTDLAANSTLGRYNVKEAYAEINVPVLKNVPFAKELSFDVASRYSDYSNFGNTHNSKVSISWRPIGDLLVRANWGQGFRAPALGDTFGGGSQSFDTYLDPCDSKYGQAGKDPAVAARCAAGGVPAGFRQLNQNGAAVSGGGAQSPFPFLNGAGNAFLQPETSVTDTLGFVYSPSFLTGFSASLDLYRVKVDNRITGVSAGYVANQCYVSGVPSFCTSIQRTADGQILNLSHGNANLGSLKTDGADMSLGYTFPMTQYGRFSLNSVTTYTHSFSVKSAADADWENYVGEYYYNKFKSVNSLNWTMGNWAATWTARFYSRVKDECWDTDVECNTPNGYTQSYGEGYNLLGSETFHDLNVSYKTSWKGQIMVGVNNALNKKPRITYAAAGVTSAASVDAEMPLDRFFYVRYNQSF